MILVVVLSRKEKKMEEKSVKCKISLLHLAAKVVFHISQQVNGNNIQLFPNTLYTKMRKFCSYSFPRKKY